MAMGRGLTLQCGDDAVNLTRSWNTRESRLGAGSPKPGLSRVPDTSFHTKKHGGHFQLAANFQARASPTSQLITPASLMSVVAKDEDQARDAFEDAHSEEDDSDDEDNVHDDDEEDESAEDDDSIGESDSHSKISNWYNYRQTLEEEEGHSSSDDDDDDLQEPKDSDEEVEDAIEFILQEKLDIEKRQFGFISLEDTNRQDRSMKRDVEQKEKQVKTRSSTSFSSDKENIDVQNINSFTSSQRIPQKSSYQNGISAEEKAVQLVERGILKEPLKTSEKQNVTGLNVRKSFPTRPTACEQSTLNSLQGGLGQNRERDETQRVKQETSVKEDKKDSLVPEQITNHKSPVHQGTDTGKAEVKKASLSPHAAPFVPLSGTSGSVKGRAQHMGTVTQEKVGPQTEPSSWSSEYDSQQVNSPQVPEEKRLLPKAKELPAPTNPVSSPLRSQTTSKLSDKELENEYEWRKYKLIRKVKQILKPQTSVDGQSSLGDNCVSQLCDVMTEASPSFAIFTTYPKELVIVLEEVIHQAVEETLLDDDYQKGFIDLFHKLSAFSPHFDGDFKTAIKHTEKLFLQPFIGAHLEKLGLRYCQFLGRLYGSFCQMNLSTKDILEEIIFSLCKKWIIFNEKGTNPNAEVTELTFAKCLQAVTKEIGPFCPQDKWKNLMEDVKGQIFSKRPQNVKEVFLEILLHSEGVAGSSSNSESVTSESVAGNSSEEVRPPSESVSNPSKLKGATSELPVKAGGKCNEEGGTEQSLHLETSSKSQLMELSNGSGDTRKSVEHTTVSANASRESQSGSESTRRDSSPYRSPYNDSTKATYLSTKLKASSLPIKAKDVKNTKPPVRKKIKENEHSVGCNGDSGAKATRSVKTGEPSDWWDYDTACEQQRAAEAFQEEKRRAEEEAEVEDGEIMVDTHEFPKDIRQTPTNTNGESEFAGGVPEQGIGMEVWDEELNPNPPPIMYPSATKRFINGNSLRFQEEQYQLNISRATKTYEVYVGDNGDAMSYDVTKSGDNAGGIQQLEDDVVILENSDSDDDDDDDEVPMIWGDDLAGIPPKQTSGSVPHRNVDTSATGTIGSLSHTPFRHRQELVTNRSIWSSPWNSRPLVVFQEEDDNESSLSQIEILAQKALEERKHNGGPMLWQNASLATEGKVD